MSKGPARISLQAGLKEVIRPRKLPGRACFSICIEAAPYEAVLPDAERLALDLDRFDRLVVVFREYCARALKAVPFRVSRSIRSAVDKLLLLSIIQLIMIKRTLVGSNATRKAGPFAGGNTERESPF